MFIPWAPSCWGETVQPPATTCTGATWQGPFAAKYSEGFYVVRKTPEGNFSRVIYDDGLDEPIWVFDAADMNGDNLTDVVMCRSPKENGFKNARWVIGYNRVEADGNHSFEYYTTSQPCSYADQYALIDENSDGADELYVIPRFRVLPENQASLCTGWGPGLPCKLFLENMDEYPPSCPSLA